MRTQLLWSKLAGFMIPFSLDQFATVFDHDGKPVIFADDLMGGLYRVDEQNIRIVRLKNFSSSLKVYSYTHDSVLVSDEFNRLASLDAQGNETFLDDGKRIPASTHGAIRLFSFINDDRFVAINSQFVLFDLILNAKHTNSMKLNSYDFSPLDKYKGKFKISAVRAVAGSGDLVWVVLDGSGIPTKNDQNRILALIKLSNGTVLKKLSLAKAGIAQSLPNCSIASFDPITLNIVLQNGDTLVEAHQDGSHQQFMKGQFNTKGLGAFGVKLPYGNLRFLRTSSSRFVEINTDSIDLDNPLSETAFFQIIKRENAAMERQQGRALPELPTKLQFTSWLRGTSQLKYFFEDFYHLSVPVNGNNIEFTRQSFNRELNQTLYKELLQLGYVLQAGILAPRSANDEDSGADLANLFALLVQARQMKIDCEGLITP